MESEVKLTYNEWKERSKRPLLCSSLYLKEKAKRRAERALRREIGESIRKESVWLNAGNY